MRNKAKLEKYERNQFNLSECKAHINIIDASQSKGKGYATAFLNIQLPDGRWVTFEMVDAERVPLYKEKGDMP